MEGLTGDPGRAGEIGFNVSTLQPFLSACFGLALRVRDEEPRRRRPGNEEL